MRMFLLMAAAAVLAVPGHAALLGSWSGSGTSNPNNGGTRLVIGANGSGCYPGNPTCIFLIDQTFSAADTGSTFTYNASNTPTFDAFSAVLTNGSPDTIWLFAISSNGNGGGNGSSEATWFGLSTTDFAGNSISSITMAITDSHLSGSSYFTSFTMGVYGDPTVPEPSTVLLTGAGAAVLAWWRRHSSSSEL